MNLGMTKPMLSIRDPDLQGLRVLVVGLAKSGFAAARLANDKGAQVLVVDRRAEAELGRLPQRLRTLGVEVRPGGHPARLADDADLLVISPGVPSDVELLRAARDRGVPVWAETELAARFCRGRVIGITGSNGKSTVTTMAGQILRGAQIPGGTGGNLDTPFSELLAADERYAVHAVELSSFQLEWVEALRPDVAVIVNLSPDHLDRYASYDDYARAKARLLEVQEPSGAAVLNADDRDSARFHDAVRGRLHTFSTRHEVERGAFLRDDRLTLRTEYGEEELIDANELPLPGEHNVANALAAALACRLAGCVPRAIIAGLRAYRPLAHRLEPIAEVGGVRFYNDSKATNSASMLRALNSFASGSVHLILGGQDKGTDWRRLADEIGARAKRVLLVGEAAPTLERALSGRTTPQNCRTVPQAVRIGFAGAEAGDVVLLSPGCASFDQYRNFEERGEDFRHSVSALLREESGDA
jgi:UDP-N-acetylmuramoylalanine--D-glutamate ligase